MEYIDLLQETLICKLESNLDTSIMHATEFEARVLGYGVCSISCKKHMICKLESNQYTNIHAGR
jgi:hypothetical protein